MVYIYNFSYHDLPLMQLCNILNLVENYSIKYFLYHYFNWPELSYCANTSKQEMAGYVLAKMEEDSEVPCGHITSLAVNLPFRKLGIARQLLDRAPKYVSLHVRVTNLPAIKLYKSMGYEIFDLDKKYYQDLEDAYDMRFYFPDKFVDVEKISKSLELDEEDRFLYERFEIENERREKELEEQELEEQEANEKQPDKQQLDKQLSDGQQLRGMNLTKPLKNVDLEELKE